MMVHKDPERRKEQMANLMRERYRTRREIAKQFLGTRCKYCGSLEHLVFGYKDKNKGSTIPLWGWSSQRFAETILSCETLCRKCYHAKKNGRLLQRIKKILEIDE